MVWPDACVVLRDAESIHGGYAARMAREDGFEYGDTIKTDVCGVHCCFVTAKDGNNRFMRMPEDILNYRHPRREFIESFLKK